MEQFLGRWEGLEDSESTRKDAQYLKQQFPHVNFKDKVFPPRD